MQIKTRSVYLYDIAGIYGSLFVAPFISVGWNATVIIILCACLGCLARIGWRKIAGGIVIISLIGALLDFATYIVPVQLYLAHVENTRHIAYFGLYCMVMPMLSIGAFNYVLARHYFSLDKPRSRIIGVVMGILTAPWLLYIWSYRFI